RHVVVVDIVVIRRSGDLSSSFGHIVVIQGVVFVKHIVIIQGISSVMSGHIDRRSGHIVTSFRGVTPGHIVVIPKAAGDIVIIPERRSGIVVVPDHIVVIQDISSSSGHRRRAGRRLGHMVAVSTSSSFRTSVIPRAHASSFGHHNRSTKTFWRILRSVRIAVYYFTIS
ncbi:hypothetical protein AVEN_144671-1, partial [Araneus ventricosus]